MDYSVFGMAIAHEKATFSVKENNINFGITPNKQQLPNPAELFLGAFAACCLKNIERFSEILKFDYESAQIKVTGERQNAPPKMKAIHYSIEIKSQDKRLNTALLHKNIQKYGTIYNTLKETCEISGDLKIA